MTKKFTLDGLPLEEITVNGRLWEREKVDESHYQWVRPMEEAEYDWDSEEDSITLVGTEVPIRVVSLQLHSGEWFVEAAETAGPSYHRPGFTELISSEFSESHGSADEAFKTVRHFINRLS